MSKITVKITGENVKGSESGQELKHFEKDEVYTLDKGLANVLIDGDLAVAVDEPESNEDEDSASEGPVFTSDAAKKHAQKLNAEGKLSTGAIAAIEGSGQGGAITKADVDAASKAEIEAAAAAQEESEEGEDESQDSDEEGQEDGAAEEELEEKAVEESPENKAVESAPENKAE